MTPEDLRAQLPALQRVAYMNAGTAGPLPAAAAEAMQASIDEDLRLGRLSPRRYEKMKDDREDLRRRLAELVGAVTDDVVLTTGTVAGLQLVFAARGPRPGTRTLVSSLEHPDALLPVRQRELDGGSRVEVVDIPEDATDADIVSAFRSRLAVGDPLDSVLLSHVSYATGRVLPVAGIVDAVGDADVLTVVDGVQAVGAIPVDATGIGAHAYVFSGHKWLQGPEGVGAVVFGGHALPRFERLSGLATGVVQRGASVRREDGVRALEGIVPTKEAVRGALAALGWRDAIGQEQIASATARNTELIRQVLARHPAVHVATPAQAAGLISFRFDGLPGGRVSWELGQARVAARDIPGTDLVRLSSGFYLDAHDIARLEQGLGAVGATPEPEACPMPTAAGAA